MSSFIVDEVQRLLTNCDIWEYLGALHEFVRHCEHTTEQIKSYPIWEPNGKPFYLVGPPTQRLNHRDSKKTIERDIEVFTRVTNSEAYSQTWRCHNICGHCTHCRRLMNMHVSIVALNFKTKENTSLIQSKNLGLGSLDIIWKKNIHAHLGIWLGIEIAEFCRSKVAPKLRDIEHKQIWLIVSSCCLRSFRGIPKLQNV